VQYMINVDLEAPNVSGGGTDCQSDLHEPLGRHYDLTVHVLGCGTHGSRSVHRPPTRYWDDNDGKGYTLQQVVERILELQAKHRDAHARRCRICGVQPNLPEWD
jgi:hypothetical protein